MENKSFNFYKKPKLYTNEELWRRFQKGAFLVEKKVSANKTLVYGFAAINAFPHGIIPGHLHTIVREKLGNSDFSFEKISPIKELIRAEDSRICDFFKICNLTQTTEVINYAQRASVIFGVSDVYLIFASDTNYSVLIGLTIHQTPDLRPFKKYWGAFRLSVESYQDLLNEYAIDDKGKAKKERQNIAAWLQKTTFAEFHRTIANRVLGQPSLSLITVAVYTYLKSLAEDNPNKVGILLAGSSGTGKTETYRALRDYFREQLPFLGFVQYDATSLTASGFKGNDVSFILKKVKEANSNGFCIAFIDEFDKKMCHELSSNGFDYNAALQSEFLTILEAGNSECDTSNTLFILAGSFEKIRKEKANKRREIGFGENDAEDARNCHAPITREEILENGALYELMGRLPVLVNYGPLDDESIAEILNRKVEVISKTLGISIILEGHYQEEIIEQAKSSKMGTRIFDQKIYEPAFLGFSEANQKGYPLETTTIMLNSDGYTILINQEEEKRNYYD